MPDPVFAAIDLGASGGRVVAGTVSSRRVDLDVVHRFPNGVVERDGHLRWDLGRLVDSVLDGLAAVVARHGSIASIGIDTWGVDYGLLDADGALLADPIAYRDARTDAVIDGVHAVVPRDELFARTGLQFLPFTTIYQLAAEREGPLWDRTAHVVLLPDLLVHLLTGVMGTEATDASTTGLVDVCTGTWATDLLDRLGLPTGRFPPIDPPGTVRGTVTGEIAHRIGIDPSTPVTTVGSHDTASAVVGVPATTERFAYVASGTWSLVGLERRTPVLGDAARDANFTNERGVDDRIRFLRNVGGLWLLQECLREWDPTGTDPAFHLDGLLAAAAALPDGGPVVDANDPTFLPPGPMAERIGAAAVASGDRPPTTPAEVVRCIVDSLAAGYADTVAEAGALAGTEVDVVHVVGGGSRNDLLCRRTAELTGRPVVAGPVEATALGNVLVQARAHGAAPGTLEDLRALVADSTDLRRYEP